MLTTPLHPRFGVEIHDVDLREVTATSGYDEIRDAFERDSLLLFRDQQLDDEAHLAFGRLFGPIEVRSKTPEPATVSPLTNLNDEGTVIAEDDQHLKHLIANQFWHTDSTFLPVPALANILTAQIVSSTGGETEFVSTRAAWQDMPETLKARARDAVLHHRYAHSRAKIDAELARSDIITMWSDQAWRAVWPNPVTGEEALYIASHAFAVDGLPAEEGQALIDGLTAFATQDVYVYSHAWRPGDVLLWDERATLHRGRPWPYAEERTFASICVSAGERDGLELVRPHATAA